MNRFFLSLLASLAIVTPAAAAPLPAGFVKLPAGFCQSVRYTGEKYRPFVGFNALTKQEAAELARDPIMRETIRRMRSERWGSQIASGQRQRCDSVTYYD